MRTMTAIPTEMKAASKREQCDARIDTANDVRQRLEPYYEILDFHVEGAMLYFRAKKR